MQFKFGKYLNIHVFRNNNDICKNMQNKISNLNFLDYKSNCILFSYV